MDEYIKQSIEARRNAIEANLKLDANGKKKVVELFDEIKKLGEKCKDVGEFETEFQKSSLNNKYTELFTELATKVANTGGTVAKSVAGGIVNGVADRAMSEVKNSVLPTRAAVNQKAMDAARSVPILGDAIDVSQKASYAGHLAKLFGARKKK